MNNWKDYFLDKFSDKQMFMIEQFDMEDKVLENYRVTSTDPKNKTEIIFQIHIDGIPYVELFGIHFNHPDSPKHSAENRADTYGFDGVGNTYDKKNIREIDDWLDIPIHRGWIERTVFFDGEEMKTECVWIQEGISEIIPIDGSYGKNYGCLLFPLAMIHNSIMEKRFKKYPERLKIVEGKIPPMILAES